MSGGYVSYNQHRVCEIAEDIQRLVATNGDKKTDEYGIKTRRDYPPEIIERFKEAAHTLEQAADMVQRVDWLVSGDDGENSFLERWENEVRGSWDQSKKIDDYKNNVLKP